MSEAEARRVALLALEGYPGVLERDDGALGPSSEVTGSVSWYLNLQAFLQEVLLGEYTIRLDTSIIFGLKDNNRYAGKNILNPGTLPFGTMLPEHTFIKRKAANRRRTK